MLEDATRYTTPLSAVQAGSHERQGTRRMFHSARSGSALFVATYLFCSGCWVPGDDRHPDERGCQSNAQGAYAVDAAQAEDDFMMTPYE